MGTICVSAFAAMKYVLAAGDGHKGGGGLWVPPGRYNSQIVYCPGALRPPPFPTLGQAWGTYVVCGCCRAGTIARANALTQIVPNLSSLYTLFYSVIYNSVVSTLFTRTVSAKTKFFSCDTVSLKPSCSI